MLPSGYKRLAWVQNAQGSYFKTGLVPDTADTCVVFDGCVISGDTALYGSRATSRSERFTIQLVSSGQYRLGYAGNEWLADAAYTAGVRHRFCQTANTWTLDGTALPGGSAPAAPLAKPQELYALGALNTGGTATNLGVCRLYAMGVYKGGAPVAAFVPCRRADGVVGVYDTVAQRFVPPSGSGGFTPGPAVDETRDWALLAFAALGGTGEVGVRS